MFTKPTRTPTCEGFPTTQFQTTLSETAKFGRNSALHTSGKLRPGNTVHRVSFLAAADKTLWNRTWRLQSEWLLWYKTLNYCPELTVTDLCGDFRQLPVPDKRTKRVLPTPASREAISSPDVYANLSKGGRPPVRRGFSWFVQKIWAQPTDWKRNTSS